MQQIWTNPSLQRSFIAAGQSTHELLNYLRIAFTNSENKEILVFPNMEYQIYFYDANYGTRRSVTGLVTNVYEDQIKLKVLENEKDCIDCATCCKKSTCNVYKNKTTTNTAPMPTCNCILNPPDMKKYDGPKTYFIPVENIMSISYVKYVQPVIPVEPKEDVKVMLLGISATMLKAIVIHLEFFDDSINDAVKYIDIEKDGIYNIVFEGKDKTIFEVVGKVHAIKEIGGPPPHLHGPVHENVGFNNSIYNDCCLDNKHTKDDFMKEPPVRRVEIIVDTSDTFEGAFEVIPLDAIRDCTLIQSPNENDENSGSYNPDGCNCDDCCKTKPVVYTYDNDLKAVVKDQKVTVTVRGKQSEIDIDTLLKYYLGID